MNTYFFLFFNHPRDSCVHSLSVSVKLVTGGLKVAASFVFVWSLVCCCKVHIGSVIQKYSAASLRMSPDWLNWGGSVVPPWPPTPSHPPNPIPETLLSLVSVRLPGPGLCSLHLLYTLFLFFSCKSIQLYLTAADSNSGHCWQLKPSESSRSFW